MKLKNYCLLFFTATVLSACAPEMQTLPDDQSSEPAMETVESLAVPPVTPAPVVSNSEEAQILEKYSYVDPKRQIQDKHLKAALIYFDKNASMIKNKNYLSVIDFSKSSKAARFFVINMKTGAVWALHTSHGKGSDSNHDGYAEKFSNTSGSNASSLGFYLTAETYTGGKGYSLRLDGLSSTNSNARRRAVVIHQASYVKESSVIQGRSWGCPAIATEHNKNLINMIKNGSLIYAAI